VFVVKLQLSTEPAITQTFGKEKKRKKERKKSACNDTDSTAI